MLSTIEMLTQLLATKVKAVETLLFFVICRSCMNHGILDFAKPLQMQHYTFDIRTAQFFSHRLYCRCLPLLLRALLHSLFENVLMTSRCKCRRDKSSICSSQPTKVFDVNILLCIEIQTNGTKYSKILRDNQDNLDYQ